MRRLRACAVATHGASGLFHKSVHSGNEREAGARTAGRRSEPRGLDVEAAPLDRIAADLLQVTISPVSRLHGVEVGELRLPVGASLSMIIREGETLVPERRTVLRHGDDLLVVTPRRLREQTEERLRQVSSGGRLAQWLDRGRHEG